MMGEGIRVNEKLRTVSRKEKRKKNKNCKFGSSRYLAVLWTQT